MAVPTSRKKSGSINRESSVHHLEQVIEDDFHGHVEVRRTTDVNSKAQPIEQFVRYDVVRCRCGIARHDKRSAKVADSKEASKDIDQVQDTGNC